MIVARFRDQLLIAVRGPEMQDWMSRQGMETFASTPAEFRTYIQTEIVKWSKVVKAAGIKAD